METYRWVIKVIIPGRNNNQPLFVTASKDFSPKIDDAKFYNRRGIGSALRNYKRMYNFPGFVIESVIFICSNEKC